MIIELDPFSPAKSPKQALKSLQQGRDIYHLVDAEKDWLEGVFPGTVERNRTFLSSWKNVVRIARNEQMKAFIVRQDKITKGLATTIFGQSIIHPSDGRQFTGTDLDYWLVPGLSMEEHNRVARRLVDVSQEEYRRRAGRAQEGRQNITADLSGRIAIPHQTIIGTIAKGDNNPALGLAYIMDSVGEPAELVTPDGKDDFGITKDGSILQLYVDRTTLQATRHA